MNLAKFILAKNFSASSWPKLRPMLKARERGIKLKINELRDGMKRIDLIAKVTEKSETREVTSRFKDQTLKVASATIADETGTIKLTLWNEQIGLVNVNDTVKIQNGYITSFRGEIQLNSGRYGTLTVE